MRLARPLSDLLEVANVAHPVEYRLRLGFLDPIDAGVVRAALHIFGRKFLWQRILKKRYVLLHQLLLKILCACRDNDPFLFSECGRDGRHEIGERFPRTGARLDEKVLLAFERTCYRFGHFYLAITVFIVFMVLGDEAILTENALDEVVFHS